MVSPVGMGKLRHWDSATPSVEGQLVRDRMEVPCHGHTTHTLLRGPCSRPEGTASRGLPHLALGCLSCSTAQGGVSSLSSLGSDCGGAGAGQARLMCGAVGPWK